MLLTALALALATAGASSGQVALRCVPSAHQTAPKTTRDFYRVPPPGLTQKMFVRDIWRHGLVALVIPPSEGWLIDYSAGTVAEVNGGFSTFRISGVTDAEIEAVTDPGVPTRNLNLNRITGHMILAVSVTDVSGWNKEFGTRLQPVRLWDLDCQAAPQRF